ncbi:ABC transporter substrate-binding protein [Ammoniphilus sp. CFH 90114]|uniref:ABC transporter substrate-binding protein n=1 Tax=Ammoniphilus sp. CFH 90114 TaxID=2493665 RepID=UPI00100E402F|nr:ABC transporter substrate-binding protein [Ammoniphilus sp. CFH 90114]RXT15462.1 ABC transporter substrate-binding protein [Ammoniphilus sp. CFH 90114]
MKKGFLFFMMMMLLLTGCGTTTTSQPSPSEATPAKTDSSPPSAKEEAPAPAKTFKIGITQIVEHPALDASRNGFLQALKDAGFEEGKNLQVDVQIAQGDMNNNMTIAQKFVGDKVDLILAIATPSAQAAVKATSDIPVIFSMISDPIGAKLVDNLEKPGKNVTGSSSNHPDAARKIVESIKEFVPDAKKVGIIYNSGEQNSVVSVNESKEIMSKLGLEPVEAAITTTAEVTTAVESLVNRADVILLPQDNTVISAFETIVKTANDNKMPIFAPDSAAVQRGGFSTYSFDYFDLGYTTGKLAVEVLEGKQPGDLPVVYPEELKLLINPKAAELQGVTLTDEMKNKAELVQ